MHRIVLPFLALLGGCGDAESEAPPPDVGEVVEGEIPILSAPDAGEGEGEAPGD